MEIVMIWLANNITSLSILGAAIAFSWSVIRFSLTFTAEQKARDFEHYHKLIKDLVSPENPESGMWIDRQVAIVYELRRFKNYHEVSTRILKGLKTKWENDPEFHWPQLIKEIELTLKVTQRI